MSEERLRPPPSERFASPFLVFDLQEEIAALRAEPTGGGHGHRQKTLYKGPGRTVALFVLEAGAGLPEHAAGGTVTVQALEGELAMMVGGEAVRLTPGQLLVMAPGVRHDVRAATAAAFLLQVSAPAGA